MASVSIPTARKITGFSFDGKPGLWRKVTAAESDKYEDAIKALYGPTNDSLGWFVPFDAKPAAQDEKKQQPADKK
jgi:hypothetical protein